MIESINNRGLIAALQQIDNLSGPVTEHTRRFIEAGIVRAKNAGVCCPEQFVPALVAAELRLYGAVLAIARANYDWLTEWAKISFPDDLRPGVAVIFHPDGCTVASLYWVLSRAGSFVNTTSAEGSYYTWFSSGRLAYFGAFDPHSGRLRKSESWEEGTGGRTLRQLLPNNRYLVKRWDANGKLFRVGTYDDEDRPHGWVYTFCNEGNLICAEKFRRGVIRDEKTRLYWPVDEDGVVGFFHNYPHGVRRVVE